MKFGAHVSIAGGINKAPQRAAHMGCECFQIFTRSPRGGKPPVLDKQLVDTFLRECEENNITEYYVHTPYYINLASEKEEIRISSIEIIKEELERSSILGAKYAMTHLGSSKGMDRSEAVRMVGDAISRVYEGSDFSTELLLENAAGQGATIGDTFEELAEILEAVGEPKLGVCIDTAHMLAAGYDIRTKEALRRTVCVMSDVIGINKIKLLHGNDSKVDLGERKDRHEHIGEGKIGIEGFNSIVHNSSLKKLNMIVETPPDKAGEDIQILKGLRERN